MVKFALLKFSVIVDMLLNWVLVQVLDVCGADLEPTVRLKEFRMDVIVLYCHLSLNCVFEANGCNKRR